MTDARVTQEALEHWTSNANARATQIALEHWVNPSTTNVRAILTQIGLEHWVRVDPPVRNGPMVTMVM